MCTATEAGKDLSKVLWLCCLLCWIVGHIAQRMNFEAGRTPDTAPEVLTSCVVSVFQKKSVDDQALKGFLKFFEQGVKPDHNFVRLSCSFVCSWHGTCLQEAISSCTAGCC